MNLKKTAKKKLEKCLVRFSVFSIRQMYACIGFFYFGNNMKEATTLLSIHVCVACSKVHGCVLHVRMCVCVCIGMYVAECVRACVRICTCLSPCVCVCVSVCIERYANDRRNNNLLGAMVKAAKMFIYVQNGCIYSVYSDCASDAELKIARQKTISHSYIFKLKN